MQNLIKITYGDFDMRVLNQVCERHNLPLIEFENINLMDVYGEYKGEVSGRGGYKKHKLIDAYADVCNNTLDNAHNAMADTKAMVEIVKRLVEATLPF